MWNRFLKGLRTIAILVWFNAYLSVKRSPFILTSVVLTPLSILFFIYLFGGLRATTYGLVGGLVSVVVSSSVIIETEAAFARIMLKVQDMFVASPVTSLSYTTGIALSELSTGLAGILIFIGLILTLHRVSLIGDAYIFVSLALTWGCISALGFIISTYARDPRDLWTYSPVLSVLLSFVPPVFYPLSYVPSMLRPLTYLVPTTYAAEAIRDTLGISAGNPLVFDLGLTAYTALLLFIASNRARWRES
ncbi:MAG: ABC transporter permease [Candidatus Marsarchaeota archaeon]|nr:ABC transporter permease [Candidatus Marsarchaeota archaeon]